MKFEELYDTSMELWPNEIDISDGKVAENGVLFPKLSSIWNEVEDKSKLRGEWYDLMAWIIFGNFHEIAKVQLQEDRMLIRKTQIDINKVRNDFVQNLKVEGYEDMLDEFRKTNPHWAKFE